VTAATIGAVSPTYTGQCPTTVKFDGTIAFTAGTRFTYSFNRFVNGVQQVAGGGTVTSGGGIMAVNDSISISSSTSGRTFDQIWVHNISGGQSDVYSNEAAFTVTCQSSTGGGGTHLVGVHERPPGPFALVPQAPTSFSNTTDPNACAAHVNLLFCNASLQAGDLALIWNWSDPSYPSLDGYRVYRVDGGKRQKVVETSVGKDVTGTFLNTPPSAACFVVDAYVGKIEGVDSRAYCFGGAAPVTTSSFSPTHVKTALNVHGNTGGLNGVISSISGDTTDEGIHIYTQFLEVGNSHYTNKDFFGDKYHNEYARSGVAFDLSSLAGRHVYKAILRLHIDQATVGVPYATNNASDCAAWVAAGIAPWWNDGNMVEGQFDSALSTGKVPGPEVAIDVTPIVQSWMQGAQNFGLVLKQDDENLGAFYDGACMTQFNTGAKLDVTHD
jgi:hypothetical protein